ncbi:MAG: ThuA domain-containing protein [Eubacteriales bacterium]
MGNKNLRVTVWNEFRHEKKEAEVHAIYPNGLHAVIGEALTEAGGIDVTLAALDDPEQGLPDEILNTTDVLVWWGHMSHREVDNALVERIRQRVYTGKMGFVPLHSAHHSKPFMAILGTTGDLSWGDDQKEIVWNLCPSHPIAAGIPAYFELEKEEMYSEPFYIPTPDELVFGGWFEHGNMMRSGCTFRRGAGKIFYFQPGHEYCRSFYNPYVRRIIVNGVRWAAPADFGYEIPNTCVHVTSPIV